MRGSWHRYRPGERWLRAPSRARLVLEVPGAVAVCFDAPVVELFEQRVEALHPSLSKLGPDLLADPVDVDEASPPPAVPSGRMTVAVALLDQRALAGIGNEVKNLTLWVAGAPHGRRSGRRRRRAARRLIGSARGPADRRRDGPAAAGPSTAGRAPVSAMRDDRAGEGARPRAAAPDLLVPELPGVGDQTVRPGPADRDDYADRDPAVTPANWCHPTWTCSHDNGASMAPRAGPCGRHRRARAARATRSSTRRCRSRWTPSSCRPAVLVIGFVFAIVAFRRIDALTGTLVARNAELEARGASARALHRVSFAIASLSDVDDVLDAIVDHARDLLAADVAVLLLEDADGRLGSRAAAAAPVPRVPRPRRGASPGARRDPNRRPTARRTRQTTMLPFVDARRSQSSGSSAPLQRGGETRSGLLAIGAAAPRGFDADEVETLASLAEPGGHRARARPARGAAARAGGRRGARADRARAPRRDRAGARLREHEVARRSTSTSPRAGSTRRASQVAELGAAARAVVRRRPRGDPRPAEPDRAGRRAWVAPSRRMPGVLPRTPGSRSTSRSRRTHATCGSDPETEAPGLPHRAGGAHERPEARGGPPGPRRRWRSPTTRSSFDRGRRPRDRGDRCAAGVPHYGLRSMRERAAAIGAELDIADGPRGGRSSRWTCHWPGTSGMPTRNGGSPMRGASWPPRRHPRRRPRSPRIARADGCGSSSPTTMRCSATASRRSWRAWGHEVVGQAADGPAAVALAPSSRPTSC